MNKKIENKLEELLNLKTTEQIVGDEEALNKTEQAIKLAREINHQEYLVKAFINKAKLLFFQNAKEQALKIGEEALQIALETKDKRLIALSNNNIASIYSNQSISDKAIVYFNEALKISQEINDNDLICQISKNMGALYVRSGELSKANYYLRQALNIAEENKNDEMMAIIYSILVNLETILCRHEKALEYSLKTASLFEKIGNHLGYALGLNLASVSYLETGYNELAYKYLNEAKELAIQYNFNSLLGDIYHNIAIGFYYQNDFKSALKNYKTSIKYRKYDSNCENLTKTITNMGEVNQELKNYELAEKDYKKAYLLRKKYQMPILTIGSCIHLANLYLLMNRTNDALEIIKEAEALNQAHENLEAQINISDFYNKYYFKKNDFEKALKYLEAYHNFKNEELKNINHSKIQMHKAHYEIDMLQNEYHKKLESERINTVVSYSLKTNEELAVPYDKLQSNIELLRLSLLQDSRYDKYFNKIGNSLLKIDQLTKSFLTNTIVRFKSYINLTKMIDFTPEEKEEEE